MTTIEDLKKTYKDLTMLISALALMGWDQRTYMPEEGANHRAEAFGFIHSDFFKRATSDEVGNMISNLKSPEVYGSLSLVEKSMVDKADREYRRAKAIPPDLMHRYAVLSTKCERIWETARKRDDFEVFKPHFKELLSIVKEMAGHYGYKDNPYDALIDDYEPGMTSAKIKAIIYPLRDFLVPLVEDLSRRSSDSGDISMNGHYPGNLQKKLFLSVLRVLGFDFSKGRIDETAHPFTTSIGPGDIRISTKYPEHDFTIGLYGTMHECGHGMYEMGYDSQHVYTPVYGPASLGIHESQSLMFENHIGRSLPFLTYFYPKIQEIFPRRLSDVSLHDFYRAVNTVKPSLIRIDADEVTYNLHIIIRFELEDAMINDRLEVDDLPAAWNEKYKQYLGIEPPSDADGVLQDVHWSSGMIGYFPTYMLGTLYSAQFFAKALEDMPNLKENMTDGDIRPLVNWLREKIHKLGAIYKPEELMERVTGSKPDPKYFIDYITAKFSDLYK